MRIHIAMLAAALLAWGTAAAAATEEEELWAEANELRHRVEALETQRDIILRREVERYLGEVAPEALLLFLIIFAWTPPHFWALALYRKHEYAKAGVPMLPVTHGDRFTQLHVLLYTVILTAVTLLPFVTRMSGPLYLVVALALDAVFVLYALKMYLAYSDHVARRTFRYSILYLAALFAALLIDHYLQLLV